MKNVIFIITIIFTSCELGALIGLDYDEDLILPINHYIEVPHLSQNDTYSCGTTSVAMAVSYHLNRFDEPLDKDQIWEISGNDIDIIHNQGHDTSGYINIVNYFDLNGKFINNLGLHRLKFLISNDLPVVIFIRPDVDQNNTHALLVNGYDDKLNIIYVEDPSNQVTYYSYCDLIDRWDAWLFRPRIHSLQAAYVVYPKD